MLMRITKCICLVVLIAVLGLALITSSLFAEESDGGTKEGIKVHGHWKIVVVNQDGTVDSITEFENALTGGIDSGGEIIVDLLTYQGVYGGALISLENGTIEPCDDAGSPYPCFIGESFVNYGGVTLSSTNLTISDPGTSSLTFSGSVIAAYATTISKVYTNIGICKFTNISMYDCKNSGHNFYNFTDTIIGSPPSVEPGQQIQVTVSISFS